MKTFAPHLILSMTILMFGCSPYVPTIKYDQTQQANVRALAAHSVSVGNFTDNRGTPDNWLGAVRNGYGAPVKKLYTDGPTSDVVRTAFVEAFAARNITESKSPERLVVEGTIIKYDCSTMFNYEAHAQLQVNVVSWPSRVVLYSQTYRTDNTESGWGGGLYGGYKDLALMAQQTLSQTIDKFFADPAFVAALTNPPKVEVPSKMSDVAADLRALDQLRKDGLLTDEEFEAEKKRILDSQH